MRQWMRWMMLGGVVALAANAHADAIAAGTYSLNDVTVDGYALDGTLTLNSSGVVSAADVTLQDAALGDPLFTQVSSAGGPAGYAPVADYAYVTAPGVGQLSLEYLTELSSPGVINLCIASEQDCNAYQASSMQIYVASNFGYGLVDLGSGSLLAENAPSTGSGSPSLTPEPSALTLLGTAVLGMTTLMWKRRI
jgi:hypothetical protein